MGISPIERARRAVFFDRDGVLNRAEVRGGRPYPPASLEELELVPEAAAAVERVRRLGFMTFVVTNQPDVGRGTQLREAVEEMNAALGREIAIDEFFVCYHSGAEPCECRKPEPGMLLEAAARHGIDLAASYLIGDRWRDIDAGARAGCRTVLIDFGYQEKPPAHEPCARVQSLVQAVDWIAADQAARGTQ